MNIEYNYHTHNHRCGHAGGDCYDYANEAVKKGIKKLGFSDHGPFKDFDPGFRMAYDMFEDYKQEAYAVKRDYRDKLDVKVGVEIEYLESQDKYYDELLTKGGMEYLIMGQHFYEDKNGILRYTYEMKSTEEYLDYAKSIVNGIKTGYFSFLAHPDLICIHDFKWDYNCDKAFDMIIDAALDKDFVIEYNGNGFRRGIKKFYDGERYEYPHDKVFKKVADAGVKVIINSDCHGPSQLCDEYMELAYEKAKELGLNLALPKEWRII